ncbi:MAG: 6-phosphogluconolactonase [Actinomycetia bacterium]|nr:6-phosphogluconolactonase [Actinomycetes bacterium]
MYLDVYPTPSAAAHAAAAEIAQLLAAAVATRGTSTIALSGGNTPGPMVRQLANLPVPWENVHLFQVDERAVPSDDPARNWTQLLPLANLVPRAHRHPMPVEVDDADTSYAKELAEVTGRPVVLDVVHLGLGADGHTASLVPDDPAIDDVGQAVSWVNIYGGHRRLSLTLPVLTRARHQVWLVAGADKAAALKGMTQDRSLSPAARAASGASATVFADVAAAPTDQT